MIRGRVTERHRAPRLARLRVFTDQQKGRRSPRLGVNRRGSTAMMAPAVLEARRRRLKRVEDLTVGSVLAVVSVPVIVVLAVCIAVLYRTWRPFFVHERVGYQGKRFALPKLRTLPPTTPPYLSKYDIPTDIGRFASFLRRTHLDELPQLLVVPLGWISLVGPRPLMPADFDSAPRAWAEARSQVVPGCTGLWQIGVHSHLLQHEATEYDMYYSRHASVRLDLWVIWRTLLLALRLAGPIELTDVPAWARLRQRRHGEHSLSHSG